MAKISTEELNEQLRNEPNDMLADERPQEDTFFVKAANMNIKQYVPSDKPGVYDDEVDTLIEADERTGYQNSIEILVPTDAIKKHKRYFTISAGKRDKTARIVNGELGVDQGASGTLLEFVLAKKVHRKPSEQPATDTDDTPEKVA